MRFSISYSPFSYSNPLEARGRFSVLRAIFNKLKDPHPEIERDRYVDLHGDPIEGNALKRAFCNAGLIGSVGVGAAGFAMYNSLPASVFFTGSSLLMASTYRLVEEFFDPKDFPQTVIVDTKPDRGQVTPPRHIPTVHTHHLGNLVNSTLATIVCVPTIDICAGGALMYYAKRCHTSYKLKNGEWILIDPDQMKKREEQKEPKTSPTPALQT